LEIQKNLKRKHHLRSLSFILSHSVYELPTYGIAYICLANERVGLQENKESEDKDEGPAEYISYWKPNVTINLVEDFTRYSQNPICF
jgi:hypothetical protein